MCPEGRPTLCTTAALAAAFAILPGCGGQAQGVAVATDAGSHDAVAENDRPAEDARTDAIEGAAPEGGGEAGMCAQGSTQCSSATQIEICGSGSEWGAPTTCPYACVGAACGGACVPGNYQCDATRTLAQQCSAAGVWETIATCTSSQACVVTASGASCAADGTYALGYASVSSWTSFAPTNDTAYLMSVVANLTGGASSANVTALGVDAQTAGGDCDLYLYSDSGGTPATRLTFILQVSLASSGNVSASPQVATTVTNGQTYWLGAVCYDAALYQDSIASESDYLSLQTFGTQMASPYPIGSANMTGGIGISLFMDVQNVP